MSISAKNLVQLLRVKKIGPDAFIGQNHDIGSRSVYGGQTVAQALMAGYATASEDKVCHSLHGYFISRGDKTTPITYRVTHLRDGSQFSSRRIDAVQHNQLIFSMLASFHSPEESYDHTTELPVTTAPHKLDDERNHLKEVIAQIPEDVKRFIDRQWPFEIRPVKPMNLVSPKKQDATSMLWLRFQSDTEYSPQERQAILAYISDFRVLLTTLMPHGVSFLDPNIRIMSLDHALWFHRSIDINDWFLYCVESPSACDGRGYTRGQIYTKKEGLVASTSQEGLIRKKR